MGRHKRPGGTGEKRPLHCRHPLARHRRNGEAKIGGCKMKKLGLAILLVVFGMGAAVFCREGSSGTSSLFLLGAGTRAMGMGGSFVAVADDASAVFWNPAGLARLSYGQLGFSHVTLPEGSEYDFAGLAYPTVKAGSFAVGFLRVGTDGIFSR